MQESKKHWQGNIWKMTKNYSCARMTQVHRLLSVGSGPLKPKNIKIKDPTSSKHVPISIGNPLMLTSMEGVATILQALNCVRSSTSPYIHTSTPTMYNG